MPFAKSKSENSDVMVEVKLAGADVVEDVAAIVPLLDRVVVDPVDIFVDVDTPDNIVAAPAATMHMIDNPTPIMEPVGLIFILRTPRCLSVFRVL
ncbi:MAG TPA: hypothetical protein VF489_01435 [Sphingobium sp.]